MRLQAWILAALCLSPAAHAEDDWLAGEYEVVAADHPDSERLVLVIKRDGDGRYRQEMFKESGRELTRLKPWREKSDVDVHVMANDEMQEMHISERLRAPMRCAEVDLMILCRIPDGAGIDFDGHKLGPGYFGSAMHVGLLDVRKRPPGAEPKLPADATR